VVVPLGLLSLAALDLIRCVTTEMTWGRAEPW
jgi:hypothetical protein